MDLQRRPTLRNNHIQVNELFSLKFQNCFFNFNWRDVLVGGPVEPLVTHSEMVLDVAATLVCGLQLGVELAEDVLQRLAADVRQHVQATSVKINGTSYYQRQEEIW